MFNKFNLSKITFKSNPDMGEQFRVVLSTNDFGSPVNKVVREPRSNRPYYDGAKFDPATMSLRAQLSAGIDLHYVVPGQLENDPNKLLAYAKHFEQSLAQRYDQARQAISASVSKETSVQTSSIPE